MKKLTALLAVLALCMVSAIFLFKCNNPFKKKIEHLKEAKAVNNDTKQIAAIQYIYLHDTTVKYVDKSGNRHSAALVATGTDKQLALFYKKQFDSTCRQLNIKQKQIDDLISLNVNMSGNIVSTIDQMPNYYEVPFNDSFLHGYALIDSNVRTMRLHYEAAFKLKGTIYWSRPHKFLFVKWGRPIYKSDFTTNCPNVNIDSIMAIKIIKK